MTWQPRGLPLRDVVDYSVVATLAVARPTTPGNRPRVVATLAVARKLPDQRFGLLRIYCRF